MEREEIRAKIAELRHNYARLTAICGSQGISQETKAEYAKQISRLQEQLELN